MALEKIGRYNITAELGKGAMGVVYKAADPNIGRTVAIKTTRLDTQGLDSADLLRRFKNEARSAGTLNHPNIVTIYDAGEQDCVFYIAMEYLEGETLQSLLTQHRALSVEKVTNIVRQVCAGLDYAHAHGVIHRDIKPANIMLAANGSVKVMDFGIAKAGGTMTATGTVLGTPNYMSPEQVKGKIIDGRSDLFSVGVVLYEMLTGEKPFDGQNVTTIIYKIVSENPIPPRELDITIHPGLSAVVTKALAKIPDERYQTGAALVADLENHKSVRAADDLAATGNYTAAASAPVRMVALNTDAVATAAVMTRAHPATVATGASHEVASGDAATARIRPKRLNQRLLAAISVLLVIAAIIVWRAHRRHQQAQFSAETAPQPPQATASTPAAAAPSVETPPSAPEPAAEPAATPGTTASQSVTQRAISRSRPKSAVVQPAVPSPTPPATEAPSTGTVRVTSAPPGATVTIDGAGSFVTPFDSPPLTSGSHLFSFSKLGTAPVQRRFDVAAGKTANLDVSLAASGGVVEVQSDPPGAAILLDEKPTNKFTPAKLAIPQGEHKIRLRMAGYKDENTAVTLAEGQTVSFSPKLVPAKTSKLKRLFGGSSSEDVGTLEVTTRPDGAHLTLNGAAAAQTTPAKLNVKPGKYDLAVILSGYKAVHRSIEVEKGKTIGVDEVLEKEKP